MRKALPLTLFIVLLLAPCALAAEEFSPTVSIDCPAYVAQGGDILISVGISQTYIELSTFEVDMTTSPGWGTEEQSYFTFEIPSEFIEALSGEETYSFQLELGVQPNAPEKQYTVPLVFYGKAGECADGCVPFRIEYEVSFTVLDTQAASEKITQAQDAFSAEEYSTAERLFGDAKAIYELLGDSEAASGLEGDIADAQAGAQAKQLYESGTSKLNIGNTTAAKDDFTAARQLFEQIGNSARVSELDGLIAQCQQQTQTPPPTEDGGESYAAYYAITGVAVVIIAALVVLVKRQ